MGLYDYREFIANEAACIELLREIRWPSSLSDLYANLLAASMDKATASGAHPAFVEIIKQLTPDEAKLVGLFVQYSKLRHK